MINLLFILLFLYYSYAFPLTDQEAVNEHGYRALFSRKSPYSPPSPNIENEEVPDKCEIQYIYAIHRHGTRYSLDKSKKDLLSEDIKSAFDDSGLKKTEILEWLDEYYKYEEGKYGKLSPNSHKILSSMMDRLYKKHEKFFKSANENRKIRFDSTNKERAIQTRDICKNNLIKNKIPLAYMETIDPPPSCEVFSNIAEYGHRYSILRSFETCTKYQEYYHMKSWYKDVKEIYKTYGHSIVKPLLKDIFYDEYINYIKNGEDIVQLLYHACQMLVCTDYMNMNGNNNNNLSSSFSSSSFSSSSSSLSPPSFCSLFTDYSEILSFYNFIDDYFSYYGRGSGNNPIIYSHSCLLLNNIIESIDNVVSSNNNIEYIMDFKFGHAETIMPLFGLLNLFNSTGLLNTTSFNQPRSWRGSSIVPMAANIHFEVYKCEYDYKIRIVVNEEDVKLDIDECRKSSYCLIVNFFMYRFCPWSVLRRYMKERIRESGMNDCNFQDWKEQCGSTLRCKS